jgi:hypothetical protein
LRQNTIRVLPCEVQKEGRKTKVDVRRIAGLLLASGSLPCRQEQFKKMSMTEVGYEIQTEAEIGMPIVVAGSNDIGYAFTRGEAQS